MEAIIVSAVSIIGVAVYTLISKENYQRVESPCNIKNDTFIDPYGNEYECYDDEGNFRRTKRVIPEYDGNKQYFDTSTRTVVDQPNETDTEVIKFKGLKPARITIPSGFVRHGDEISKKNACLDAVRGEKRKAQTEDIEYGLYSIDFTKGNPYVVCEGNNKVRIVEYCPDNSKFDGKECAKIDVCVGRPNGLVFPVEGNDQEYVFCFNGVTEIRRCEGENKHFDASLGECVENSVCYGVEDGTIYPGDQLGGKFYHTCEGGLLIRHDCKGDTLFWGHGCAHPSCIGKKPGMNPSRNDSGFMWGDEAVLCDDNLNYVGTKCFEKNCKGRAAYIWNEHYRDFASIDLDIEFEWGSDFVSTPDGFVKKQESEIIDEVHVPGFFPTKRFIADTVSLPIVGFVITGNGSERKYQYKTGFWSPSERKIKDEPCADEIYKFAYIDEKTLKDCKTGATIKCSGNELVDLKTGKCSESPSYPCPYFPREEKGKQFYITNFGGVRTLCRNLVQIRKFTEYEFFDPVTNVPLVRFNSPFCSREEMMCRDKGGGPGISRDWPLKCLPYYAVHKTLPACVLPACDVTKPGWNPNVHYNGDTIIRCSPPGDSYEEKHCPFGVNFITDNCALADYNEPTINAVQSSEYLQAFVQRVDASRVGLDGHLYETIPYSIPVPCGNGGIWNPLNHECEYDPVAKIYGDARLEHLQKPLLPTIWD